MAYMIYGAVASYCFGVYPIVLQNFGTLPITGPPED